MDAKFISRSRLPEWLRALASRFEVLAPQREGASVVYRALEPSAPTLPPKQPELATRPTESAKKAVFPLSEALFTYKKSLPAGKPGLELREADAPRPCLVFGLPPCDARGFLVFDPLYSGTDNYYSRRSEQAVLIVKTCARPLSTCFCNWVGGSPDSSEGADVLATELKDGFLLEPVSDKGALTLDSLLLQPPTPAQAAEAAQSRAEAKAALPAAPELTNCVEALRARFDDAEFWRNEAAKCLSCGACTYLCPTCYCFNISDEEQGSRGVRLRNWDSCMLPLFTLEASGHNARSSKAARLRNRVNHKFSYYPGLHKTEQGPRLACCGCGRCIKSCPSAVDIRRIITDALGITRSPADSGQNTEGAE